VTTAEQIARRVQHLVPTQPIKCVVSDVPEIYIYDVIDDESWSDTSSPKQLITALSEHDAADRIRVRINSAGGSVTAGMTMHNLLAQAAADIEVVIDGAAWSIASVIAMAGDTIRIAENASIMIHDPWTVAVGDATEMRETAQLLDKIGGQIAATYAGRTGRPLDEMHKLMSATTWLTGEEAVAAGFADEVLPVKTRVAACGMPEMYGYVAPPRVLKTIKQSRRARGDVSDQRERISARARRLGLRA
jgi:ATP-dependent Clp endopeptidase proteolytic subunit ClpP